MEELNRCKHCIPVPTGDGRVQQWCAPLSSIGDDIPGLGVSMYHVQDCPTNGIRGTCKVADVADTIPSNTIRLTEEQHRRLEEAQKETEQKGRVFSRLRNFYR